MGESNFYKTTIRLDQETYNQITEIAKNRGESIANVIREQIRKGLASDWIDENSDMIADIVRKQMDIAMKPHVERLAALSSKSGHMSATAAFLNVQALMDLVPVEKRKNVREMYESARKKAAQYMKTKADDFNNEF